jgi:hypothetical protein
VRQSETGDSHCQSLDRNRASILYPAHTTPAHNHNLITNSTSVSTYTTTNTACSTQLNNLSDIKITNPLFFELLFSLGFMPDGEIKKEYNFAVCDDAI